MAGYYNPPPFPPPFPPQQSPPNMNYNAYSAPTAYEHQQQYSPTSQNMYGPEPPTPLLDQNQMEYFFNEVRSGNIPPMPSTQPHAQPFPPPQPPPQPYAPQYQYSQYGNQSQTSPTQEAFQPPPGVQYNVGEDVAMADASREDGDVSDEEGEEYSPPDISTHGNVDSTSQGLPGLGQIVQGKRSADPTQLSTAYNKPPFNPFKPLSHYEPAPSTQLEAQSTAKIPSPTQQPGQNPALRDKAVDAVKDFHAHGIGYSQLAQEPGFDDFDKSLLRQLYAQYNIPQEPVPAAPVTTQEREVPSGAGGERISELKRLLGNAGFDIDDVTLASLTGAFSPSPLVPAPGPQQEAPPIPGLGTPQLQQDSRPAPPARSLSTSTPGADAATPNEGRNVYLAKLKAMKGKGAATQQPTPAQGVTQSNLPGLGASTPRRIMINRDALQRKLQAQREAQARSAKQSVETTARPQMPPRADSMSSINYESGQVSAQSGSDAAGTPVMDMSSPEEGEDVEEGEEMEEGEVDEEDGEMIETLAGQPSSIQSPLAIPGLPPKPPETRLPAHVRNDSDQSVNGSPRAGLPPRPPASRQPYPYPPAVPSPRNWQQDQQLKRPASSAFGSSWDPRVKRQYPPQLMHDVPEPVVIDISSEEEGEMSEDEMEDAPDASVAEPNLPRRPDGLRHIGMNQQPRTLWKPQQQSGQSSAFATPPIINTPDPIQAARQEEAAKQKAILEAKKEALKRQIQLKEAQKKQLGTGSPAVTAAALSSPATRDVSTPPLSAIRTSPVTRRGLPTRNTSSPLPASLLGRAGSVARQAAFKSLEADIKSDEKQMEALQAQMEQLRQDVARKNAEKAALAEEIKAFGIDPEGMSHAQMQEVRDSLAEETVITEVSQAIAIDEQEHEEEEESDVASDEKAEGTEDRELYDAEESVEPKEADDPRAVESSARVQIHNVPFKVDKIGVRSFLKAYDITGISLPLHGGSKHKKAAGYAFVDFLYPAEAQVAISELSNHKLGGAKVRLQLVKPAGEPGEKTASKQKKNAANNVEQDITEASNQDGADQISNVFNAALDPNSLVEGRRVYIGNLAFNAKEEDVWSWAFGCDPQAVHIPRNPRTDRSTGYAFIEFANSADAQRAVQALNGTKILNRKLSVQLAKPPNGQVQPDATSAGPIQPVHVQKSIVQASQQSESSGSESDDDESDDDAMSVSEEGSVEEGEVARDGEVTKDQPSQSHPQPQPIAEEDSEDGEESDEMEESESDEDEEVTGDVGVSLKDVEALPMDEDGASSDDESSESEISAQDVPSDDEEGEIEEPLVPTMPGNESEEEPEEEESEDSGSEDGQVVSKNAAQAITSVQTNAVAEQSEAMAGLEVRTGEPAMHDMLVDSTASFDQAPQSTFVETKTIDEMELADDNDDEFYEPENEVGEAKMAQPGEASITQAEEDDYDPEFDAAFEEAFAEIDDTSAEAGGDAANPLQVSATTANGTLAENVQHAPEEAQPDRSSGIPGLGMQNGAGSAADAMELSEDGEIVSESGNASAAVATADSTHVPSSSFVPAAYADHHFGDSTISSNRYPRRFSSPRVKFPIPKWRPLGTQPQSSETTTTTPQFTPYQSALKSLKAYRYHPNYVNDVPGGIKSLSYSHRIDLQQPLCVTETDGGDCTDPHCPGQHFKDMTLPDQDIIRFIGTFDKPAKSMEERNKWANGLRQLIEDIRKEGINDVDQIANKVVAYRRAFVGDSILDFDSSSKEEVEVHDKDEALSEGEVEE